MDVFSRNLSSKTLTAILIVTFVPNFCFQNNNKVEAIKCWVCQSSIDPKCADPFDNITLPIIDCNAHPREELDTSSRAVLCRKIRQKVNGDWRTSRDCGYLEDEYKEGHCSVRHANGIYMEVCSCKGKDGCNSSYGMVNQFSVNFVSIASIVLSISIGFSCLLSRPFVKVNV